MRCVNSGKEASNEPPAITEHRARGLLLRLLFTKKAQRGVGRCKTTDVDRDMSKSACRYWLRSEFVVPKALPEWINVEISQRCDSSHTER